MKQKITKLIKSKTTGDSPENDESCAERPTSMMGTAGAAGMTG